MNANRANRVPNVIVFNVLLFFSVLFVLFLVKQSTFQSTCSEQHSICLCKLANNRNIVTLMKKYMRIMLNNDFNGFGYTGVWNRQFFFFFIFSSYLSTIFSSVRHHPILYREKKIIEIGNVLLNEFSLQCMIQICQFVSQQRMEVYYLNRWIFIEIDRNFGLILPRTNKESKGTQVYFNWDSSFVNHLEIKPNHFCNTMLYGEKNSCPFRTNYETIKLGPFI